MFVLDGWSEFPRDEQAHTAEIERASVLALLGGRAVIATSRSNTDSRFTTAELAPLDRGQSLAKEPNDHFVNEAFEVRAYRPTAVSIPILDAAAGGDQFAKAFVVKLGHVGRYHAALVSAFLAAAEVDAMLEAFGSALASFPEARLHEVLEKILKLEKPMLRIARLLHAVLRTPSAVHRSFHRALVVAAVQNMERLDFDVLALAARLLATLRGDDVAVLQSELPPLLDERVTTLAYLAEDFTGAVMIDEGHRWIDITRNSSNT